MTCKACEAKAAVLYGYCAECNDDMAAHYNSQPLMTDAELNDMARCLGAM